MERLKDERGHINPRKHNILIIEDNPINMAVIRHVVRKAGYHVIEAVEGLSGYELATKHPPDLILLDVIMPGIDGYEVCRLLKANHVTAGIPVIFMTGLTDTEDVVHGFELGAVDYVMKPFKTAEVLARINTHLTLRNLQKGLQREIVEREKLIVDLDAFARTVAHDLKTPIHSIVGYSETLAKNFERLSTEQMQSMLDIMAQTAFKMSDIIDSLLLLARIRQEDAYVEIVAMGDVIHEVLERLKPMIREYDAHITLPESWPKVRGYGPWLEEVWVNYMSNGIKYGGTPPRLEIGATEKSKTEIVFWVKDNGAGLSGEDQLNLFQPFVRLSRHEAEGYGLGLSIVQRVMDKLNGRVGVNSVVGEGSTFYFTLPVVSR
ncbi:MAG: hybrid sensor histidine kinase/response regulator [Anaerolineales bacterium]|nr:hybrid sensor histidine kinase/response regulator [Anaerolineales bacterium]